ncbi:hypothetical protein PNEG_02226 [Pneumocystis murina B123]|uniref:Mitochondrial distribution and morphology protein 31 n=1 Tax=Pneumocystis murina (strain B123) TaxID=1069680 RepID=M7PGR0_PNEMU|nr:hypothetical protein PNEG_02226 [Pneumocystis murina B123]EMR09644.1 hypothetical protein PNEG_02226 [Pneumocystis murina B123]
MYLKTRLICFHGRQSFSSEMEKNLWRTMKYRFFFLKGIDPVWRGRRYCFLSLNQEKRLDFDDKNEKKRRWNYFLKNIIRRHYSRTIFSQKYSYSVSKVFETGLFKIKGIFGNFGLFFKSRNLVANYSELSSYKFPLRAPSITETYRPTKEVLLSSTSGFFGRLKIRMKYRLMRQIRPFNIDDISAMFTWLIACNILWIIVGTTTFFSLVLAAANSVFAQEYLATKIGEYLTKETGITVLFESAIVPKWKDGTISFRNVFISRSPYNQNLKNNVRKGIISEISGVITENTTNSFDFYPEKESNYTQFHLIIENIDVVFSFVKWFSGTGIIKDIDIKGVRGVIDSSNINLDNDASPLSPKFLRKNRQSSSFEIENFRLKNVLVTVFQSKNFRPFTVSIYNCELPRLRKQWLLYDILNANTISGSYDNSLFTLHPHQTFLSNIDEKKDKEAKKTRLRIDNVNIDHINKGIEGPIGWITYGYVDFILDFVFPNENENINFMKAMHNIIDNIETIFIKQENEGEKGAFILQDTINETSPELLRELVQIRDFKNSQIVSTKDIIIDIKVALHGVKANVPLFKKQLSYVSNALIRPIVAYINSHNTYISVACKVIKNLDDFNGSWTIYDSELINELSKEIYNAFANIVMNQDVKRHYIRTISAWSLEMAIHAFLTSLIGIIHPV